PAAEVAKLEGYDAVVLGSALYGGGWLDDAVEFLESFQEELARRSVWLFSSGPTEAGDPVAALGGWRFPEELAPLAGAIGARDTALFAGRIDPDQLSMQDWLINRSMRGAGGDFRDFAQIRSWAANVAQALVEGLDPAARQPGVARSVRDGPVAGSAEADPAPGGKEES